MDWLEWNRAQADASAARKPKKLAPAPQTPAKPDAIMVVEHDTISTSKMRRLKRFYTDRRS